MSEAERLAELLECSMSRDISTELKAAAELRRLSAELAALKAAMGEPVAWLESEPSTMNWPIKDLFFGFGSLVYSSRMHFGDMPKGVTQNRLTPLHAIPKDKP